MCRVTINPTQSTVVFVPFLQNCCSRGESTCRWHWALMNWKCNEEEHQKHDIDLKIRRSFKKKRVKVLVVVNKNPKCGCIYSKLESGWWNDKSQSTKRKALHGLLKYCVVFTEYILNITANSICKSSQVINLQQVIFNSNVAARETR